ncbi:MAG: sulfurtransferase TusA family protein [Candidatus Methanoperedens sp.]|jgi:tRNA 2-thiouridine synthesizing protein A|nr:sulfurtransferase TusA family protein [Candidatus Methanoperedens sp.]PKL53162.1 MAG: sulfurtransferase TusA family protein [Candidatus Methanoperedenaceae archaeon HGW-Methanoperedenaceae-1]
MEKLDVRGKVCPLPLFYAKRKISEMKPGEEVEIIADDLTAKETIPKWSKFHKHEIVSMENEGETFRIIIKAKQAL